MSWSSRRERAKCAKSALAACGWYSEKRAPTLAVSTLASSSGINIESNHHGAPTISEYVEAELRSADHR